MNKYILNGLYTVDENGQVFSVRSNKFIQPSISNTGYVRVYLYNNNKKYRKSVHRLVAEAFIPNPLNKPQVNHIDGNKLNNHVSNLEWNTGSENLKNAFKLGLMKPNPTNAKLSKTDIMCIFKLANKGVNQREIALQFKVTQATVSRIKNNKIWKGVTIKNG